MLTWDDAQYLKFADERTRPAAELLARVAVDAPALVVDLGCGPGNSTALLARRWPAAEIVGVDNSEAMLARAGDTLPRQRFVLADIRTFRADRPIDVLFANASLHWLPDHARILPALLDSLAPGGTLALQMPDNHHEPSHRLMREVIRTYEVDPVMVPTHPPIESVAFYYDLLAPRATRVDIWQTRYEQVVPDAAAIVEWFKGTGLRPYLEAIPPDRHPDFERDYEAEIDRAYPRRADGRRLFSFPRLFVVATR